MWETRCWFLQLLTGLVLVILLGVHMAVQHLDSILAFFGYAAGDPVAYATVVERAQSLSWTAFYIIFLALALYHGLYGLRAILLELSLSPTAGRILTGVLAIIGVAAFVFGTYITWQSYALPIM